MWIRVTFYVKKRWYQNDMTIGSYMGESTMLFEKRDGVVWDTIGCHEPHDFSKNSMKL